MKLTKEDIEKYGTEEEIKLLGDSMPTDWRTHFGPAAGSYEKAEKNWAKGVGYHEVKVKVNSCQNCQYLGKEANGIGHPIPNKWRRPICLFPNDDNFNFLVSISTPHICKKYEGDQ